MFLYLLSWKPYSLFKTLRFSTQEIKSKKKKKEKRCREDVRNLAPTSLSINYCVRTVVFVNIIRLTRYQLGMIITQSIYLKDNEFSFR